MDISQFLPKQQPHENVFAGVLANRVRDNDVDVVTFLDAAGPLFIAYEEATRPRKITLDTGTKNYPNITDYHVICKGLSRQGTLAYRIISIDSHKQINIMDIDRLLDDAELFRGKFNSEARAKAIRRLSEQFENRLVSTLEKGLPNLSRRMGQQARWVYDLSFIDDHDADSFISMVSAQRHLSQKIIDDLEQDFNDEDKGNLSYLFPSIKSALQAFDDDRMTKNDALLAEAAAALDPEVMDLLRINPSARITGHYRWLHAPTFKPGTDDRKKRTDKAWFTAQRRKAFVKACPIVLLIDGIYKHPSVQGIERDISNTTEDALMDIFGVKDRDRITYYQSLTEECVSFNNAQKLPDLSRHLERQRTHIPNPRSADDWTRLATLIRASNETAAIIQRDPDTVFQDLTTQDPLRDHEDMLSRFFDMHAQGRFSILKDLQILKNRIAASLLSSKIIMEGYREGINIPVRHAFYMASGTDLLSKGDVESIPRKLRKTLQDMGDDRLLISGIMDGVGTNILLENAFNFCTHRGEWDAKLRALIITNRLYEHGAGFTWPSLPMIHLPNDPYTIAPLERQSDLLKDSDRLDHELWRQGKDAIAGQHHFVSLRKRGGIAVATAKIMEPDTVGGRWQVEQVVAGSRDMHNIATSLFHDYIDCNEFLGQVDIVRNEQTREYLRRRLGHMAKHDELMGINPHDPEENRAMLQALHPYLGFEDWDADDHGCISTLKINAMVRTLIRNVKPHYRKLSS